MRQQTILQVLRTRQIEHDTIDISAPGNQDLRKFMREKGKKIDGQRNALPPQIFNGEEHRWTPGQWKLMIFKYNRYIL